MRMEAGSYTLDPSASGDLASTSLLSAAGGIRYRSWTGVPISEQGPWWTEKGGIGLLFLLNLGMRKWE